MCCSFPCKCLKSGLKCTQLYHGKQDTGKIIINNEHVNITDSLFVIILFTYVKAYGPKNVCNYSWKNKLYTLTYTYCHCSISFWYSIFLMLFKYFLK